jgi:hypothetical protein
MKARIALALALALTLMAPASADTTIVNENFESYADQTALKATWVPTIGNGSAAAGAADVDDGYLIAPSSVPVVDPANYPGIQGQAVDHIGATASSPGEVNQYGGIINQPLGNNPAFQLAQPDANHKIVLSYDLFDGASGNERMSLGLRNVSVSGATVSTANLLEMGLYNSNSADETVVGAPVTAGNAVSTDPGFYSGRGYAVRVNLFGTPAAPYQHQPDWQYFRTEGETWGGQALGDLGFDAGLDRTTDTDSVVTIGDIGRGWHHYEATITNTTVTVTLDLFRDGLRNTSKDPVTPGGDDRPGSPGVDARLVFPIPAGASGFNALRFGGPSGLLSGGTGLTAFDNISLKLVDVVTPPANNADFNNDGIVNGADFIIWQKNVGATGQTDKTNGDANGDGSVNAADLAVWQSKFGGPPASAAVTGVPEPASVLLTAVALFGFAAARRK